MYRTAKKSAFSLNCDLLTPSFLYHGQRKVSNRERNLRSFAKTRLYTRRLFNPYKRRCCAYHFIRELLQIDYNAITYKLEMKRIPIIYITRENDIKYKGTMNKSDNINKSDTSNFVECSDVKLKH